MWLNEGESLASAESAVSNNSTMGNIPHQTGQLSCPPPPPQTPTPSHIIPILTHSHLGHVTENSTYGYRWEIPHTGQRESNKRRRFAEVVLRLFGLYRLRVRMQRSGLTNLTLIRGGGADCEHRALVHMQAPKLLPLLQPESDYRQAWGQAGHWKHRHEQTIRYYLKESSAFQRKMVPLSVTLTIGSSTWHWISHLRRMNTATHSCLRAKIMRALFSPLFNAYKGKFMRLYEAEILKHAAEFTMNGYWMNNSIVFPSFFLMFVPITQLSALLSLTTSLSRAFTLVIYTLYIWHSTILGTPTWSLFRVSKETSTWWSCSWL